MGAAVIEPRVVHPITSLNRHEPAVVAWIAKDIITWNPPEGNRSDILIPTLYAGMVTEIRAQLFDTVQDKREVSDEQLRAIRVMSTAASQGKEGNIVFMCLTVAPGIAVPNQDDKIPVSYLAGTNHFNTMLTRCRIARYIIIPSRAMNATSKSYFGNYSLA
ncbi:hypothetical protein P171DRAFT_442210 [Karstenula rhodostoma CBS 690.94]|uniref:DNA2/NAM7 helicase-like C-terminal domain-containing protein n=1 Tax=Karstenula rhodostoma CBS 690.94 TaxID=1392251 RepID=A0A9P4PN55_9PLEO|nr:hypothetical protein P171DRAFT_442210 [Karstenula rhodostoma CBS 690.94]